MHPDCPTKPGFLQQCGVRRDSPPPWPSFAATSAIRLLEGIVQRDCPLVSSAAKRTARSNVINATRGTAAKGTVSSAPNLLDEARRPATVRHSAGIAAPSARPLCSATGPWRRVLQHAQPGQALPAVRLPAGQYPVHQTCPASQASHSRAAFGESHRLLGHECSALSSTTT